MKKKTNRTILVNVKRIDVMIVRVFLFVVLVSVPATVLFGQVDSFGVSLSSTELNQLFAGGALMDRMDKQVYPSHLPVHPLTAGLNGKFPANIYGDIFFLQQRNDARSDNQYLLDSLNQFLAFSKQKGILYKSSSSGWVTLISDSYTISGPNGRSQIADKTFSSLPSSAVVYAYQKDHYFSGNRYRYEITSAANGIKIKVINVTPMKVKGIFKAIDKEQLEMEFYILARNKTVCIYGIAFVEGIKNPVNVLNKRVDIPSAMSKRMYAIISWFKSQ